MDLDLSPSNCGRIVCRLEGAERVVLDNKTGLLDTRGWSMAHEKASGLASVRQDACRQVKFPLNKHAETTSRCGLRGSPFVSLRPAGSVGV